MLANTTPRLLLAALLSLSSLSSLSFLAALARPSFGTLSPRTPSRLSSGQPGAETARGKNIDLALEYYLEGASVIRADTRPVSEAEVFQSTKPPASFTLGISYRNF